MVTKDKNYMFWGEKEDKNKCIFMQYTLYNFNTSNISN